VARRRSAIYLSSAYTSCCLILSSAFLHRALGFVTNGNSPLFSHFSYNSFEVDRREETPVFNRLRLPSNSCVASVSSFLFLVSFLLLFFLLLGQVIGISSSSMSSRHHHVASNLIICYTINMDNVILLLLEFVRIGFQRPVPCWQRIPFLRRPVHVIRTTLAHKLTMP